MSAVSRSSWEPLPSRHRRLLLGAHGASNPGGFTTGCLDSASGTLCSFPGTYTTRNFHRSVFSLKLRSRVFSISPSSLSPNILRRGLWSTAMVSLSLPRVKCLVFWSAQATARASPSTGWYLDSAPVVNLLPAKTVFQPPAQQVGVMSVHLHLFWDRWNPIPTLLQSVARTVSLSMEKVLMPFLMASTIFALLALNASEASAVHAKVSFEDRRALKGSMRVGSEWKQLTWLMRPCQLLTPVRSLGSGKSWMLSIISLLGFTESSVMMNPRNSISFLPKANFSSLKVMPWREQWVR